MRIKYIIATFKCTWIDVSSFILITGKDTIGGARGTTVNTLLINYLCMHTQSHNHNQYTLTNIVAIK